jgi:hypothetical protein
MTVLGPATQEDPVDPYLSEPANTDVRVPRAVVSVRPLLPLPEETLE